MTPRKEVLSLYDIALNSVFEELYETMMNEISPCTLKTIRNFFISNFHCRIRQNLLKLAVMKDKNRIHFILELIGLLMDSRITYLCPMLENGFLLVEHYVTLIQHLKNCNATGLQSLFLRVIWDHNMNLDSRNIHRANQYFSELISHGLGNNLTVLQLECVCNNDILEAIGQHCKQLNKLDITFSWFVTDNGIKHLLFKNPKCLSTLHNFKPSNNYTSYMVKYMLMMDDALLNECCFTIKNIRIQDTNTSEITVLMLLIFLRNLESFGGYIYSRNIGDAVSLLAKNSENPLKLNLTEFWDTCISPDKATILSSAIPNLNTLYTRITAIFPLPTCFLNLTTITIDFDYAPFEHLLIHYLEERGSVIKRMALKDQAVGIELNEVAKYCPNLEEFAALVICARNTPPIPMTKLTHTRLKMLSSVPLTWLMESAQQLQYLEALICYRCSLRENDANELTNRYLKNLINSEPKCFSTLVYFNIYITDSFTISKKTVKRLINMCPNLKVFGNFSTLKLSKKSFIKLLRYIKTNNFDLHLREGIGVYHPPLRAPIMDDYCK